MREADCADSRDDEHGGPTAMLGIGVSPCNSWTGR